MSEQVKSNLETQYEKILTVISECTDDYIFMYDLTNDYYRVSEGIVNDFNLPSDRFDDASKHIFSIVYPEDKNMLKEDIDKLKNKESLMHNLEYRWIDKDGKIVWINCSGKVYDTDSEDVVIFGRIHRLGTKRQADDLTGLLTEVNLKVNYEKLVKNNLNDSISCMIIGIDNLKAINQRCGMSGGDIVLTYVSQAIRNCCDSNTKIYRMNGDKFVIRVDGDSTRAKDVYYIIRDEIDKTIANTEYELFFTISAGIVEIDESVAEYEKLKVKLEFALNQSKNRGRNCVTVYNQVDYDEYMKTLDIQVLLRDSINNNFEGYEVFYQPIIDSKTCKLIGAEALLRWRHEKYGNLSPAQFIPILEESGLIIPVGKWVAYTAIKQCKEWQQYIPEFKININLSYIQIKKSNIAVDILQLVNQIGINPNYLTFEFTESGYIENDLSVRKLIKTFNNEGIKLALDDFGTGYSNLAYLQNLNVDVIKIDRSFVNKAMQDENIYSVINHIIEMARNINLSVCIEGIENEEEQDKICKLNPDTMQGYLYGRPVPANQFFADNISKAV